MEIKKYPLPMRVFHWTVSILVFVLLFVGFSMSDWLADKPFTGQLYAWHKSFGLLVLLLVMMRAFTRFSYRGRRPELASTLPSHEKWLAHAVHKLFYVFLFLMPLSGYLMSSFNPKSSGVSFFYIPLPNFLPKNEQLAGVFKEAHEVIAFCLIALIVLHVAGVIKHRFFDKPEHDSLSKML